MCHVSDINPGCRVLPNRGTERKGDVAHSRSSHKGKSQSSVHELHEPPAGILQSRWANLPSKLLCDVIRRLEASESTLPSRKHVACAAIYRQWRELCKENVMSPELSGKLTFPISLKQPRPRDGMIQCFIKRDKSKSTYRLYLCPREKRLSLIHSPWRR
ncbi:Tubby-like F-box protein 8 [Dendrobium catenatum]|uniref:Tubby-like F-box protein 8 n=1 Tax=Dendrobium catenatum TaxID=906689 RepID=A0A2I0X8X6_9ASPA|nr:Tubby-like F-box protein 8 [Dendrobium catenatum]